MKPYRIAPITIDDYEALISLWRFTPEIVLRDADSREQTQRYLMRNPGFSFAAWHGEEMIGCALSGHDGRRGYLQHVIVVTEWRGHGIAGELVDSCLDELEKAGIYKTHLDVFRDNELGYNYWLRRGWQRRDDIYRFSYIRSNDKNA